MDLNKPIGVFDSGIGGLTVLKGLMDLLPHEKWVYLGDTARLPYGSKSPETIRNYTLQNLKYLSNYDCKAFIIACNSASTQFQESFFMNTPVFNVIDPGVQSALAAGSDLSLGVLGTKATINSGTYTQRLIAAGYKGKIFAQACPLFVPLVEEGLFEGPIVDLIIEKYLKAMKEQKVKSLILGCTHYPLLKKSIEKFFCDTLTLITSEKYLSQMIQNKNLNNNASLPIPKSFEKPIRILTTDDHQNVQHLVTKILSDYSFEIETVDFNYK